MELKRRHSSLGFPLAASQAGISLLEALISSAVILVLLFGAMEMVRRYIRVVRQTQITHAVIQARDYALANTNCSLTIKNQLAVCADDKPIEILGNDNRTPYKVFLPATVDGRTFTSDPDPSDVYGFGPTFGPRFNLSLRATCHRDEDYYRLRYEYRLQYKNGTNVTDVLADGDISTKKDHGSWTPLFGSATDSSIVCRVPPSYTGGQWYYLPIADRGKRCSDWCSSLMPPKKNVPDAQGYKCISQMARSTSSWTVPAFSSFTPGALLGSADVRLQDRLDMGVGAMEVMNASNTEAFCYDMNGVTWDTSSVVDNPSYQVWGCYCQ